MSELTQNQRSFIQSMQKSADHERHGFSLLVKRQASEAFFDPLRDAGFFAPVRNPAPVAVDAEGLVTIPYWRALDYLKMCAERARANDDAALAEKVMDVIRDVSTSREGNIEGNYHTARLFAEIVGLLPTHIVRLDDVALVDRWLSTRFNQGMVAHALDEGALGAFLASADPADWAKATEILRHASETRWEPGRRGIGEGEPVPQVEAHWLNKLLKHHAEGFGRKAAAGAAAVLEERVREVFSHGREDASYIFRPAVEEHEQNHSWQRIENGIVGGLRDVVLAWCDVDVDGAKQYVRGLLAGDSEMLRRIGLYVLAERWDSMRELYSPVVGPDLFKHGQIHELYALLKRRFGAFDEAQRAATLGAIRSIPQTDDEDSERWLRAIQLRWLSAVSGTSYEPAATWLSELRANTDIAVPDHPDFNTYMETSWGPGPSPYQVPELVGFAAEGSIVEKLKGFTPSQSWRGPSVEALVEALEKAVATSPGTFLAALPQFVGANGPYQHGIIRGFKAQWDASKETPGSFDWAKAWPQLVSFFEQATAQLTLPIETTERYSESWIVSAIADFLAAGTRSDEHAYDESLLPRALALITRFLDTVRPSAPRDSDDPMTAAINTTRGRCIEALFSQALRECRVSDRASGSHDQAWAQLQPLFDAEVGRLDDGNYEFATLAGAYLANLDYMNRRWVRDSIGRLFPADRPEAFASTVAGLAFSSPTRYLYVLLRDAGVFDRALNTDLRGRDTRKKVTEQIVLAYLWGEEALDSRRVAYPFAHDAVEDLEDAAWFFCMVRGDKLTDSQLEHILDYWAACVTWARTQPQVPAKLLDALGHLAGDGRRRRKEP